MFFFILKGVATALAPSTTILILVQVLQFASFGLYLPSIVQHINRMVDEKSLVTALLLFSSATYGLGMMVGGLVGGFLADAVGVQAMMLLLSIVTMSGFVMFMLTGRKVERISPG
jgi:MFS family permease